MSLAREIPFFGRAGGVVSAIQTVSKSLNLSTSIKPTEDLKAISEALSGGGKAALAGPLPEKRAQFVRALNLHTRVLRGFAPAEIPKSGKSQDLYAQYDVNVVMWSSPETEAEPTEMSIMEQMELVDRDKKNKECYTLATRSLKEAVEVTKKSPNATITLAFKEGFQMSIQESVTSALVDLLEPKEGEPLPISKRAQRPATLANELVMFPDRVGTLFIPPMTWADELSGVVEGLLGGPAFCNWVWRAETGDLFHTGSFKDSDKANPTGALLAFCSLLAQRGHANEANALYNSIRAVAAQHNTYTLAEEKGVTGFAEAVSSALKNRK